MELRSYGDGKGCLSLLRFTVIVLKGFDQSFRFALILLDLLRRAEGKHKVSGQVS